MKGDISKYERPALTVDCVLFRARFDSDGNAHLQTRLIKRVSEPDKGELSLIGAFVPIDARLEDVMLSTVKTKAGWLGSHWFEQFSVVDTPERDERWRVISIVYMGVAITDCIDTDFQAQWYDLDAQDELILSEDGIEIASFSELAFDHGAMLNQAIHHLRERIERHDPVLFRFLPKEFTISELKSVLEAILGKTVNNVKRSYQNEIIALEEKRTKEDGANPAHRPGTLYRQRP